MRRLVKDARLADPKETVPDPFDADHAKAFVEWLRAPSEGLPGLPRYLAEVLKDRQDVRWYFHDLQTQEDLHGFMTWTQEFGTDEERIPLALIPPQRDEDGATPST
jgi:hypothetical protein